MRKKMIQTVSVQGQNEAQVTPLPEEATISTDNVQKKPESGIATEGDIHPVLPEDYQLNLSDFALFLSVMKVKEAYENVLSIILNEPDLKLKEVKVEQVVLNKSGKRAIRLDAWAQDVGNRQFDMEM